MKKILLLFVLFISLVFPWACSDNKSPSTPSGPVVGNGTTTPNGTVTPITPTYTGTIPTATFTFTPTPTGVAGAPTNTPTSTWTWIATPQFQHNYGTSAAPNGMYYDGAGNLYIAEAETKAGTIVNAMEQYT